MVQMSGMPRPAGAGPGSPKKTAAQFVAMNKSDGLGGNPWARTAPRTGTSFDMADLLTNGMATKVPRPVLPSTNAKMEVLGRTEQTMPGDILGKKESATAIVDRMATIIRSRNLDLLNLMDDFLKRPRGSRMPIRNRAFLDVSTFRRALCYAFGDQWLGLNMSSTEFETIWKKYERKDASNQAEMLAASGRGKGYQGGSDYGAGQGQPEVSARASAHPRGAGGGGFSHCRRSDVSCRLVAARAAAPSCALVLGAVPSCSPAPLRRAVALSHRVRPHAARGLVRGARSR